NLFGESDMSYMPAAPELITSAAQDLASLHSTLDQAAASMAGPTSLIAPAAPDEISGMVADVFNDVGRQTQALYAQASAFHRDFANLMHAGATAYARTEAAGATALASAEDMGAQAGNALDQLTELPLAAVEFVGVAVDGDLINIAGVTGATGNSLLELADGFSSIAFGDSVDLGLA